MPTTQTPGGLFDGFEGYRTPTDDDLQAALTAGVVALDTNVLLDLYRYGEAAREEFFTVLSKVSPLLWLPHQVVLEFWRNRVSVLADVGASTVLSDLHKARASSLAALERWRSRTRAEDEAEKSSTALSSAHAEVEAHVRAVATLNTAAAIADTGDDPVVRRLQPLLEGKVGRPYAEESLAEVIERGLERFKSKTPPGYMDAEKHGQTEEGTGDWILWSQLLQRARDSSGTLLLVSRDEKEDWWRFDKNRRPLGPRTELVSEMANAGVRFYMLRPEDLLRLSPSLLGVAVDASTIEDASRISRIAEEQAADGWSARSVRTLLARLRTGGGSVQADVIREAGLLGGWISREKVFELGGYHEARHLNGFTKPVRGVVADMVDAGELVEDIEMPLLPTYPGPGKADGFSVPDSVAAAMELLDRAAQLTWVEAARRVMQRSDSWWSLDDLVTTIREEGLRDLSDAKTPKDTLRRDLRHRASDLFDESPDGRFRLRTALTEPT